MTRDGFGTPSWVPARALDVQVRVFEALGASRLRAWRAWSLQNEVRGALEASKQRSVERLEPPKSHATYRDLPDPAGVTKVLLCKGSSKGLGLLDLLLVALILGVWFLEASLFSKVRSCKSFAPPSWIPPTALALQNSIFGLLWASKLAVWRGFGTPS